MKKTTTITALALAMLMGCDDREAPFDASGSFEARETIISAEAQGKILGLDLEEGQRLEAGQAIGYIDSIPLFLRKQQLEAQLTALLGRKPDIPVQISVLEQQLRATALEVKRLENLVQGDAATPKQLDDIKAEYRLLEKRLEAQKSSLANTRDGLEGEGLALRLKIEELQLGMDKCIVYNPIGGTVLVQYAQPMEMTAVGKPLYKIADLSILYLRAYITGNQLSQVQLGQKVKVLTDDGKGGQRELEGQVTWVSDKAEFTPKTIQTKEERANLVYAIKVRVANDGHIKIGMYGELKFL